MQVVANPRELSLGGRAVCLAIGFFDGVHLGHQAIVGQTVSVARQNGLPAVVVTFDRHPSCVLAPDRVPHLVYTRAQCARIIAGFGIDGLLMLPFDRELSRQSAETFVRWLHAELKGLHTVCVGRTFVFGHGRLGNLALLRQLGNDLSFAVRGIEPVLLDGAPISSTRVRRAIREGDLRAAQKMLGRCWTLTGGVIRGDGLGRQLGYPTANLRHEGMVLPPHGVYVATVTVDRHSYRAVVNIGHRPTLNHPQPELRVEAHLLDFNGDLYDCELELKFQRRLRGEARFPSLDALKEQIRRDIVEAGRTDPAGDR